jgi:DNA-binding CsgD family transcriptional regulator
MDAPWGRSYHFPIVPLAPADRSRIADIQHSLAVYVDGGPPALTRVLGPVRELLRFDPVVAYGIKEDGTGFAPSFLEMQGGRIGLTAARRIFSEFMGCQRVRFGGYDPRRPEPWNRNRPLLYSDIARRGIRTTPMTELLLPRMGVQVSEQLRVLVCEGASLLAWFGGFRDVRADPYTQRDRRVLGAMVPSLRRRLVLERTIGSAGTTQAALEIALEAIAAPAFLLTSAGAPVLANASGHAALDASPTALGTKLRDAVRSPRCDEFRVIPVESPGSPPHYLAVGRVEPRVRAMVHDAARRWGLSSRQTDVLRWIVEGASNARVGAELRIAQRTVETHVTAILQRAQVGSRAELIVAVMRV